MQLTSSYHGVRFQAATVYHQNMEARGSSDTRAKLLNAAADLIAADASGEFSLREVCDAVGVQMPALYHYFGSKQGLIDAAVERGFEMYLDIKSSSEPSGDPIQDVRAGWDAHVAFGVANPGFYVLMYGKNRPGYVPSAHAKPTQLLGQLMAKAATEGRIDVPPEQAVDHVLTTNIAITLHHITRGEDPELSAVIREGVISAITGVRAGSDKDQSRASIRATVEFAAMHPEKLGQPETTLLIKWLQELSDATAHQDSD